MRQAVELEGVWFSYPRGSPLFQGLSLRIEEGEFFGIIGPNGAGKSTLLRLIAGILTPQMGEISILGRPIAQYSRRALSRIIGLVPQESHFIFDFPVWEVVLMGRNPYLSRFERPGPEDFRAVSEALKFTDTYRFKPLPISQLSAGERQLVVLARTLAQEPQILLLDEATTHLDIGHQLKIIEILERLNRLGRTILFLAHDLNLASRYCKRVLLLNRGRAVVCDRPERVMEPELIEQVYGVRPRIIPHPDDGSPLLILPRVEANAPSADG